MVGAPFDPSKAQVFVHVVGLERTVSLAATHGTAQSVRVGVAGNDWAPGALGTEVFFPNVDVGTGTTMLTADGFIAGGGAIPLVAGTLTNVTIRGLPTN